MSGKRHAPWRVTNRQLELDAHPRLRVWRHEIALPDGREVKDFWRIEVPDYAMMAVWTHDGRLILERHYRHGVGDVTLTLPAGGLEPGEEPLAAAKRELLEETGYLAENWSKLGDFVLGANGRFCKAHLFMAEGGVQIAQPDSGDLEDTELVFYSREQAVAALKNGEIAVLSCAATLAMALLEE
ncbi:putative NUDIX hydrolase [Rhodospirillaceae bacterium LM-1]|nr:putative NUDIX hydrolase [Rhodospirillaceae bacterium LM-1]